MNRRNLILFAMFAALMLAAGPGLAQHQHGAAAPAGSVTTITGELICLTCYQAHGGHGPAHEACAKDCAKEGKPMGLLTASGEVVALEAGRQVTKFTKSVNFLAGHALMCVNMPLSMISEFTKYDIKPLDVSIGKKPAPLDLSLVGKQVTARGEERPGVGHPTLVYQEISLAPEQPAAIPAAPGSEAPTPAATPAPNAPPAPADPDGCTMGGGN